MPEQRPTGIGFLGVVHPHLRARMAALADCADVRLVAAHDPDAAVAAAFAARHGLRAASLAEVVADPAIDLVIVEGYDTQTLELGAAAIQAGKAVLIDKPGGRNPEDVRQLLGLAQRHHVLVQVGYAYHYSPAMAKARAILASGALGELTSGRFHSATPAGVTRDDVWLRLDGVLGGLIYTIAAHQIENVIDLFGRPRVRAAALRRWPARGSRYEDAAAAILELDGGWLATLDANGWEAHPWLSTWSIEVQGTNGSLWVGVFAPARVDLFLREPVEPYAAGWTRWSDPGFDSALLYRAELDDLLGRVRAGERTARVPLARALAVMEVVAEIYHAAGQ